MDQTIPLVNLQDYLAGTGAARASFIERMGNALKDIGFFAVENHGVDYRLIEKAYQLAGAFFALPDSTKRSYEDLSLKGQRGFTSFGREHAKGQSAPDLK